MDALYQEQEDGNTGYGLRISAVDPVGEQASFFFAQCVARFIPDARALGYSATLGEAWRSPETCELYAKEGKGVEKSFTLKDSLSI